MYAEYVLKWGRLIFVLLVWALLCAVPGWAQERMSGKITGRVIDDSTNTPIVNANVFIANTMLGTSTDTSGHFALKNVPPGTHELVASCIGYNMITRRIEFAAQADTSVDVRLRPKLISLGIVEVTAQRPEAWWKDLERFTRLLLGLTAEASECRIVNPEILSFSTDETGTFSARATTKLVVENNALGYRLNLSLGEFRSENRWIYSDWKIVFEDLLPSRPDEQSSLEEKRDNAYYGSLRHFLIALMRGSLAKEGFTMYKSNNGMRQRLDRVLELNEDDISEPSGLDRRTLRFSGTVVVEYDRARVELFSGRRRVKASALSLERGSVRIDSRGQILDPFALGVIGDWSNEKVANQLPLEFTPKSKR